MKVSINNNNNNKNNNKKKKVRLSILYPSIFDVFYVLSFHIQNSIFCSSYLSKINILPPKLI